MSTSISPIWSAVSAEEITGILKSLGYPAETDKLGNGQTFIRSRVNNLAFLIVFYPRKSRLRGHFTSLRFVAIFQGANVTVADCNRWNADHSFIGAHLDEDGDGLVQWDIVLKGGSAEMFQECLSQWIHCLGGFVAAVLSGDGPV